MNLEQKMQLVSLAASAGDDTDVASIIRQLAELATSDQLEAIASGNVDGPTRILLFRAAELTRG